MKKIGKILMLLIVIFGVLYMFPQNIVNAGETATGEKGGTSVSGIVKGIRPLDPSEENYSPFVTIVSSILGFLQIASAITAVIMIAFFGFGLITETPNAKEEIKKKMVPMLVGLVLVFSATSIAKFIISITGAQ